MSSKTIAIIGAGPSGTSCALHLLEEGVDPDDIVIIDRAEFPRQKLCGGGITWRGTKILEDLVDRPAGGCRTARIEFNSELGSLVAREPGHQWLYDRALLDNALLAACRQRGVDVREGSHVTGIEPVQEGWRVQTRSWSEDFPWVVGADGSCGITRRASELPGGRIGRLMEGVYEPAEASPAEGRLYFNFDPILDDIPGYAWIFPYPRADGEMLWKIGIMDGRGCVPGKRLRAWTERFARESGFRLAEGKITGWPERYFTWRARAHRPGLVLIGDAWGIDPLLGEGIAPALAMGRYAARRLRGALDGASASIKGYELGFLSSAEGWNLLLHAGIARHLYGDRGRRWLEVLYQSSLMRRVFREGLTYGRLGGLALPMLGIFFRETLRHTLRGVLQKDSVNVAIVDEEAGIFSALTSSSNQKPL